MPLKIENKNWKMHYDDNIDAILLINKNLGYEFSVEHDEFTIDFDEHENISGIELISKTSNILNIEPEKLLNIDDFNIKVNKINECSIELGFDFWINGEKYNRFFTSTKKWYKEKKP